jgi:hypothetical protein
MRDQGKRSRLHGLDALKSHILAARTVANIVKTKPQLGKLVFHLPHAQHAQAALSVALCTLPPVIWLVKRYEPKAVFAMLKGDDK